MVFLIYDFTRCLCFLPHTGRVSNSGEDTSAYDKNPYRFRATQLIIPGILIGVGFAGLESDWLKQTNHETKEELQEHPHSKIGVDDFSQYAPLAAAYGLRLCGIKGLHDYVDLTIISATAYLLTGLSVYGVKTLTKVERPDGSTRNSFPSGHTATAFAGAEILRHEYWNISPWIGVAGYAVAAGTGFLRMYNNRHWLTDVVAGAGFGILNGNCRVVDTTVLDKEKAVKANPILLECLFNNLVANAIRHSSGGDIMVGVDDDATLRVSNSGDKALDTTNLFERFRGGSHDHTGTGLGLAIVKAICDFHGWQVRYDFSDHRHTFIVGFDAGL